MGKGEDRAEEALRRQSRMEADRSVWEGHWTEVAERVLPRQRDFNSKRAGGEKLNEKIFAYRYQRHFGVTAVGFDAGDGLGARSMPYLGLGTDLAAAPLHVQGPVALEQRLEYVGDAAAPYALGALNFHGATSSTAQTRRMAGLRVDVTDPAHGSESAEVTLEARQDGRTRDRLHIGQGVWVHGAEGGDQGPGTLNLTGLFIDGVLFAGNDPEVVSPVIPDPDQPVRQTHKGMVVKSTAPDDRHFRGVQIYRNDADDPASAEEVDFKEGRRGKKIKWVDAEPLQAGTEYFYFEASVSKLDVESPVRTRIGSAVYAKIKGEDLEDDAVDLGGTKVTGKTLDNIPDAGGLARKHSVAAGDIDDGAVDLGGTKVTGKTLDNIPDAGSLARKHSVAAGDIDDGAVDLGGTKVIGDLPTGQAITTSSGVSSLVGARILRFAVSDDDINALPVCTSPPAVDYFTSGLPIPSAGSNYNSGGTSFIYDGAGNIVGFKASIKVESAPQPIVQRDSGAGAPDATVPHPGAAHTGYSVANAVGQPAYNGLWKVQVGLSFSVYPTTRTGRISLGFYGYNGSAWVRLASPDVGASTAGATTETIAAGFFAAIDPSLYSKFGVGVLTLGDGTYDCTITSLGFVRWKTQAPHTSSSATPNGEQVVCFVTLPA